jgi:hypothetical protein
LTEIRALPNHFLAAAWAMQGWTRDEEHLKRFDALFVEAETLLRRRNFWGF